MSDTKTSDAQSERGATIIAVVKALQHVSPPRGGAGVARFPANVSNAGSATNVSSIVAAVNSVQFDYNGDPV